MTGHVPSADQQGGPLTAALQSYVDALGPTDWPALLVDAQWRLVWVSQELQALLGGTAAHELGFGTHLARAWALPAWQRTVAPESVAELARAVGPYMAADAGSGGLAPHVPEVYRGLLAGLKPAEPPAAWHSGFRYLAPDGVEELGGYDVKALILRVDDASGRAGYCMLFELALRPRLVSLLARGDQAMYERMARLVQPARRAAALMFCDLQASGTLSRKMPTARYFALIRRLWSRTDALVADRRGIVGKHAGDGASAYFLAEDLGGASPAARAAVDAARAVHAMAADVLGDAADLDCQLRIGLHWAGGLYLGQLVPGGRLEVTALGDEVNEAARLQELAAGHQTLATKQLVEQLAEQDAVALGLDPRAVTYALVEELAPADSNITRDAGGLAVTAI